MIAKSADRLICKAMIAVVLMCGAMALAWIFKPTIRMAPLHANLRLEKLIPNAFGDWKIDPTGGVSVVNPIQESVLKQVYSQILTRTYVNAAGHKVMLSIAYGQDQRSEMAAHFPEVCYPAQGFKVTSNNATQIPTSVGILSVRRLQTVLNDQRFEPVTYWMTIGDYNTITGLDRRLKELHYGLGGMIPDGLLFRVSTIGIDTTHEFNIQRLFVESLLINMPPESRSFVTGKM